MKNSKWFLSIWLLVGLVIVCNQVDAQFFTKSSKSIPRMGRRSELKPSGSLSQSGRVLIDLLIDEYGPNWVEALERKSQENRAIANLLPISDEFVSRNEQPLDLMRQTNDQELDTAMSSIQAPRSERSSSSASLSNVEKFRGDSLAMRALNIDRILQHLASGQNIMSFDGPTRRQEMGKQRKIAYDK